MRAFAAPLDLVEVPDPSPPPDGVVIEVGASGICRSDWHGWQGHDPAIALPHVPGHEFAGTVVEVGAEVRGVAAGERVTVPFCCGCGRCPPCRRGDTHLCADDVQPGFTVWGSFARYVAVARAEVNLVRLPEPLSFVEAAALGCRFMTAFRGVVDQGRLRGGEWLAVHGCGGVGLSAVMIGAALGARVIAIDIHDATLALAADLGAAVTVNAGREDAVAAVRDLADGGAHVSIDALGSRATCAASIRGLRTRGRHVQIGLLLGEERDPALPMGEVIARELEVVGSHGMPAHRYDAMLAMIADRRLDPARLLGKRVTLDEAGAELAAMGRFAQRGVSVIDRF